MGRRWRSGTAGCAPGAALGFTYAWARRDPAAILAAVRAGHTYLSAGPYLAWHPWPNCLAAPSPDRLSIEVARLGAPADLRLMHDGRPIARETVAAGGVVALDPPAGTHGGWYRAELYRPGTDDLLAITNPVWYE